MQPATYAPSRREQQNDIPTTVMSL